MGKRQRPGLKSLDRYPGRPQTASVTFPHGEMISGYEESLELQDEVVAPLSLRATTDPGAHLTLDAMINSIAATTLVDSGATGVFMHPQFAQICGATVTTKDIPREVRVIDGRRINSGLIIHEATVELQVNDHREVLVADITNTGRYSCILGMPWLVRHDPTIRWAQKEVIFNSAFCQESCCIP